jgi:hypothetical protein
MSSVRTEPDAVQTPLAKRKDRSPGPFVLVEKNLASLGFFTPSTKKIKGIKKKIVLFGRETDGKKIELRAVILPSAEYGLPITADQDKYLALLKIISELRQRDGEASNPIGFTSAELLRILGLKVQAGKNYADVTEWARRMTLTGICSEGVVYFAGKKAWASDTFHVFERFVSFGKEMPDGSIADKNYVWLSEWQLENINNNHLLPIDFETYKQLNSHIAKALVPLLQIWLYATRAGGCFEKRYEDLCQILNVRQYPQLSRIKEKLEPGLKELAAHGYLSNWRIQESKSGGYKIAFYHGEKFYRDQRSKQHQKEIQTKKPVLPIDSPPSGRGPDLHDQILLELTRRGISERTARDLLNNLAIGQHVMDQLEWGDFQIQQAPRGKFYNPAGLYIRLIRENITPPPNFETTRKREVREAADRAWREEQEEKARLEVAYMEFKSESVERYIQKNYSKEFYLNCVGKKKQELLVQEKSLARKWSDETLTQVAERRLRTDLATRIPLPSFEEYCQRHYRKGPAQQELLPGFVAVELSRT